MVNLVAGNRVVVLHGYDVIRDALNHPDLNGRPSLSVFEQVLQGGIGKGLTLVSETHRTNRLGATPIDL